MPYYRDALPYYYGGPFSNHSSLMTGTGRTIHSPLGSSRYAPHLSTISESPLSALRRYSPAATMSSRPKRVIDTADIDVSTPRALSHSSDTNNQHRNRLRRDRPTIRIRSQALKDNPALREHYERHEKTVGELLVEKFLIKDKKSDGDQQDILPKLHTQISLESGTIRDNIKDQCEEQLEALQKRVTRRMTRRRSSADIQMDPAQLEREVLIAQAQADALDTLVAEEQAEIEVETRMGTLIKKNLVRGSPVVLANNHESVIADEDVDRTKKLAKKVKKRKKTTDKPSPPINENTEIQSELPEPISKPTKSEESKVQVPVNDNDPQNGQDSSSNKAIKFKIEASNSVGDFSTLWINGSAAEEQQVQRQKSQNFVDQYRESVRLPAPKFMSKVTPVEKKDTDDSEEHHQVVVLPVRKRYVKDDSRNSVYLTVKKNNGVASTKVNGNLADRVDNVDDRPILKRSIDYARPITTTTTLTDGSLSKETKVAKFRSKDITESDAEVVTISESSGGLEENGERRTKDKPHDHTSDEKSISLEENCNETSGDVDHLTSRCEPSKVISGFSDAITHVECNRNQESTDFNESTLKKEAFSRDFGKVDVSNDKANDKEATKVTKEIPIKDAEKLVSGVKNDKQSENKGERTKIIIKRKPKALNSSVATVQLDRTKSDDKSEKEETPARILSEVSPGFNGGSLPNAPTINSLDSTNQVVKYCGTTDSNSSSHENQKLDNFNIDEKISSTEFTKTTKVDEESIPVAVAETATAVNDPEPLRKVKSKPVIDEERLKTESPKTASPKTKTNIFNFEENSKITGKNVADASKVQSNQKHFGELSNLDCDNRRDEALPESPNLKVVTSSEKKIVSPLKKRAISTAKDEKGPQSPVEKENLPINAKEKTLTGKAAEKIGKSPIEVEPKVKQVEKTDEKSPKLTNGLTKVKLTKVKLIDEIDEKRELQTKVEKPKLKIWNKPYSPPIQEDDGIDFWGEIESQRRQKPPAKSKIAEIAEPKNIVNEEPIVEESELKGNHPAETSPPIVPKVAEPPPPPPSLVGKENKPNKIKKKKPTESGVCKKKDQEKATAETILKQVISEGGGDENGSQQQQQQQKQSLSGESLEKEKSEKSSCESEEINRFERNLSTIAEENSPVAEEVPRLENLASLVSNSDKSANGKKLDPFDNLLSEKLVKTASKEPDTIITKTDEPKVSPIASARVNDAIDKTTTNNSEVPLILGSESSLNLPITESPLPIINIEIAPETPLDYEKNQVPVDNEVPIEEEDLLEEEPEGPGTPTNETTDETPNNISKWNCQSDLSLDEPERNIVPEVTVVTKPESGKKKTSTKKKSSGKKSAKSSVSSNSPNSTSPDSSKKKKIVKRKKSSSKTGSTEKRTIFEERSESKLSNSSDTTLKPGGLNLRNSPKNSPRNTPKQRPLDLIKMFYTTPASLLTATPRDLSKVRRAKIKKKKHSSRTASASSDSTGSTRSTQSTSTNESNASTEREDDLEQKRISSTRSNDSGFDGSPRLSNCDMACHKKCEKLTGNLCGLNQKLVAEVLQALKKAPSQSSDNQRNSDGSDHHHASGRITPPATNLPRFKKYCAQDFHFLKVLGKGSFGKVLLAELRQTDCVYAVKCLKKDVVLEDDDVECTLIERKVLTLATRHPYLCHLFCTFQTDSHLFFVMEYLNGGDLMFHIQKSGRFAESRARFYAAEIWSGLNFLHKKGIVYRDLKLDNVLLDFEGHIRIADFGMCKLQIFLDRTADTFCGTPDYMAPEIIKGLKYNQAVDWWSFGVLLYEMLTGQSPFSGCDEDELFWSICNERPFIPRYLSGEAMDVLVCLMEKDAGKRPLAHDIAVHPFFHSTQWDRLERRQLEPPFKPALEHTLDTRYFDTAFTAERPRLTIVPEQILTSIDQSVFRGFSYTNPNATD